MPMYDPNKLLADSQANAILTKDSLTVVLTVTECPEVAAGELGSWVTSVYFDDSDVISHAINRFDDRTKAHKCFDITLNFYRTTGYVFANEQWIDSFLGSNLAATEESSHDFTD